MVTVDTTEPFKNPLKSLSGSPASLCTVAGPGNLTKTLESSFQSYISFAGKWSSFEMGGDGFHDDDKFQRLPIPDMSRHTVGYN